MLLVCRPPINPSHGTPLALAMSGLMRRSITHTQNNWRNDMINFILWLLFGALIGWLASLVMRTDAQQGALLNIVVGIVGAFLGGLVFNLLGIGGSNINNSDFSLSALVVSFIGAVILLAIVNLFRRGAVR